MPFMVSDLLLVHLSSDKSKMYITFQQFFIATTLQNIQSSQASYTTHLKTHPHHIHHSTQWSSPTPLSSVALPTSP